MPRASPDPWIPRLTRLFLPFANLWETGVRSSSTRANARTYLLGLLLPGDRKSMEPIAERIPETTVDRIQNFLTDSPWDADLLQTRLIEVLARRFASPSGCLSLDDTSFPKQGTASVGVGRQWCGSLGKNANCQVGVSLYYVRPAALGPHSDLIGFSCGIRLYLPERWCTSAPRREKTRVPPSVAFAEKWRIGLALIDRVRRMGVPHRAVLADADYGRSGEFRAELREREEPYAVGVQPRSLVVLPLTATGVPERDRALSARRLATELPSSAWKRIRWGQGTQGPLVMELARVRVEVCHQDPHSGGHPQLPSGERGWLVFERRSNETKAYVLWGLDHLSLRQQARILRARWPIEQGYQQMKEELGLDHFEGRTWPGWHHHVTMVSLAHALLMELRAEEGRGGRRLPTLPSVRRWVRGQMELPMVRTITEAADEGLRRRMLDRLLGLSDSVVRWRDGRWRAPRSHPTVDPNSAIRVTS
jgi:SRSO17 transposase